MARNTTDGPADAFREALPTGAALGAAVFVLNVIVMYLFLVIDGVDSDDPPMWKSAGQTLYNAQFVSTEVNGGGQPITYNLVTGSSSNQFVQAMLGETDVTSTVPSAVYHLAPILLLVGAGLLAYRLSGRNFDTVEAAAAGATVTGGYLLLAIVGIFLFESSSGGATSAPETMPAILFVGIVFPAVFGAIGGAIGSET